ncbi:unnamed protein product [Schistosoma margrebowiei]|uniref:Uncharacterized protein n=1 Tax=Schistosoma margrebowiei TaxID=48269 RepID=A0A183N3N9_9TREM|nr:unnamed protein product [Schistosoma margrebowiei]
MRKLYDMTKKLSGNRRKPERLVKSKEGEVFTNNDEQRNRWVEHFKELLNRPALHNIKAARTDYPIDVDLPTIEEISMAIKQIKSGKAAGLNNVPAETMKADIMKTSTSDGKRVIQWTSRMQLDDLDFADDLTIISQTQNADVKALVGKAMAVYIYS